MQWKFVKLYVKPNIGKLIVTIAILAIGFFLFSKLGVWLSSDSVQLYIKETGVFAPIVFSLLLILTYVLAPLTGFPILIAGIGVFGYKETIILAYFVSLLGATLNFYIARIFGRPLIVRFVGKKGLIKIDQLTINLGVELLIITRLFQFFLFEWISYAAGLTNMRYRTYIVITAVCSLPASILLFVLSSQIESISKLLVVSALSNYLLLPIPFAYFYIKNKRKKRLTKK